MLVKIEHKHISLLISTQNYVSDFKLFGNFLCWIPLL